MVGAWVSCLLIVILSEEVARLPASSAAVSVNVSIVSPKS